MAETKAPASTYRLQLNRDFTFRDARSLVPYLHWLGVSWVYTAPVFKARSGSAHGYDVTDPSSLNPELGTEADFAGLVRELQAHGMGLLLDIVPNHMAASLENPWWRDVLENGPSSPYAGIFDIDWRPSTGVLRDQVLLPILGKPYHEALEGGELALCLDTGYDPSAESGPLSVRCYDLKLPVEVGSYGLVLAHRVDALRDRLGPGHPGAERLQGLLETTASLPPYHSPAGDGASRKLRAGIKDTLAGLVNSFPEIKAHLEANISIFNGEKGEPGSFDLLEQLLARQPYRLAFWRTGREVLNYRRFFDITDLAGVRVQLPQVFEKTHGLALRLVQEGKVDGLRIDHIDGLHDPAGYLERLQDRLASVGGESREGRPFYVVAEKILSGDETLPEDWPVAGTTGYDFLNALNALFVDQGGFDRIETFYRDLARSPATFPDVVYEKKKQVIAELFIGEVRSLARILAWLAWQDRYACDVPAPELTQALVEVTACLPVYRTYTRADQVSPQDRRYIDAAVQEASARAPALGPVALDFVKRVLQLQWPQWFTQEQKETWRQFVSQWQQLTGPAMAKGFEDTALYTYNPLVSLNDVGGDPAVGARSVAAFHQFNAARQARWPLTLNATSTHDTKRSEDVRARINVLSEVPWEWEKRLTRWGQWNRARKRRVAAVPHAGSLAPDVNTEVMLYQSLVGVWPLSPEETPGLMERLSGFAIKAVREAKSRTSWLAPDVAYEEAVIAFLESILEESPENRFLPDFLQFQRWVAYFGALNSLAQTLLKIASPGVPDFYRGTELWDFSLVDPDNRRPVDFEKRARLLNALVLQKSATEPARVRQLLASWEDGRAKLYVTWKGLQLRRERQAVFLEGDYVPVQVQGQRQGYVCAFARRHEDHWVLAVAPRFFTRLASAGRPPLGREVWGDDCLRLPVDAPQRWNNVFTQEKVKAAGSSHTLPLAEVLGRFPVALLASSP